MFDLIGRRRIGPFPVSRCLVAEVRIKVDGVALRKAVDERHRTAETQAQQPADDLPPPRPFGHQVEDAPTYSNHSEQEEEIAPPLDGLAHAVAERLVVAPEDVAARHLRKRWVRGHHNHQKGRGADYQHRLDGANDDRQVNRALPGAGYPRAFIDLIIDSVSVGAHTYPFTETSHHSLLADLHVCSPA